MKVINRNDPCACGSGKKSKKCCGAVAEKPAPTQPFALLEKANELMKLGLLDSAMWNYREAIRLDPNFVPALLNLGAALIHSGQPSDAAETLRHALSINPDAHQAYHGLSACLQVLGDIDGAVDAARKGLAIEPGDAKLHSSLIFAMDLSPKFGLAELQEERRTWNRVHADSFKASWKPHANTSTENRPLRIGYVSGDFREHSAMRGIIPMLTQFDREKFTVIAYSNSFKEDETTIKIRKAVSRFTHIDAMSDDQAAELVRQDRIDILVDLSGHSGGNRLLLFARKPAPIQVTAWGYANGTGLEAIDVFFADETTVQPGEEKLYAEEVVYLPSIVPYAPHLPFPKIKESPYARNGFVTFGSLNRMAKLTDETLLAWSSILNISERSRLIFKTHDLLTENSEKLFQERLSKLGFDMTRIEIVGRTSWIDHVEMFNEIDIALDPFPHTGGITTIESLMMGVPVVTLCGGTVQARLTASFLGLIGSPYWTAFNVDHYVEIALHLSGNLQACVIHREALRAATMDSILGKPDEYVRAVEREYAMLWDEWRTR